MKFTKCMKRYFSVLMASALVLSALTVDTVSAEEIPEEVTEVLQDPVELPAEDTVLDESDTDEVIPEDTVGSGDNTELIPTDEEVGNDQIELSGGDETGTPEIMEESKQDQDVPNEVPKDVINSDDQDEIVETQDNDSILSYSVKVESPDGNLPVDTSRFLKTLNDDDEWIITGFKDGPWNDLIIPDEIDGKKVTEIGENAFGYSEIGRSNDFTGKLVLPQYLKKIGVLAFAGCDLLTGELVIPDTVTDIGAEAFNGCSGFTGTLTLPEGLTEISDKAFSGCTGLTGDIVIPEGVTFVGSGAFLDCSGFDGELVLPDGLLEIGSQAFCGCKSLTGDIDIPDSVTTLGGGVFWGCTGFNGKLTLPSKITSIEAHTFCDCSGLTGGIAIPDGVTKIDEYAFAGCGSMDGTLSISESVETIGASAFYHCYDLTGGLKFPSGLKSLGGSAFSSCSHLTGDLVIPEGISTIDLFTFDNCYGFEGKLVLPEGLTSIGQAAFQCCGFSGDLVIPENVNSIGDSAFSNSFNKDGLAKGKLILPSQMDNLGYYSFNRCRNLTGDLTIPEGIETVEEETFVACGFTGKLTLPKSLKTIGDSAFWGCKFTGDLTIPKNVTTIGESAFQRGNTEGYYMKGTLTIPASVAGIGTRAFMGYDHLSVIKNNSACTMPAEWFIFDGSYFMNESGKRVTETGAISTGTWNRNGKESEATYTLTYELNGGKNNASNPATYKTTSTTITLLDSSKNGHTFGGWFSDSGFTKQVTQIKKGSKGNKTLYAKWIVNRYTIRYNGNGSTSGTMSDQTGCKYGVKYNLTANTYKKKGYIFSGWNTRADGTGTTYSNKAQVSNLSAKDKVVITLYAQWKKAKYTISYELGGGQNNTGNPSSYTVTTATITLKDPTRKGYTFKGWFSDSKYTTKVTEIKKGSTGNKTFYTKWTVNRYTVRFNGNGAASGSMKDMIGCSYGKKYNLTANTYKRKGFRFTGWNTKADGTGTAFADKAQVSSITAKNNAVVTLYARWKKINYTITYNVKGGNNNADNPVSYTVTSGFELKNPTRKYYTFSGWYSDSEYKKPVTRIAKGSTGNKTLYGKWIINRYKIRFNGNGSTVGSMADMTCKYGQSYNITANAFKKTGYIFNGWNTKADGSGTAYKNKAEIKNLSAVNGKVITLYARWKSISYSITFSGNGGKSGKMTDLSCRYDKSYKLAANAFVRTNYRFAGWNTKADGTGKAYADKATVKNLTAKNGAIVTLYAQWKKTQTIVWLGDSLTQGSLGDENDNLANAPYVRLRNKVDVPVEGYGFWGYNTHDIFWAYQDTYGQKVDPNKIYILWVGSCDWVVDGVSPNSKTGPVISEIDNFLSKNGGVRNYIVLGTTSRHRLGDRYIKINKDLSDHYGSHYMDVIDIINKYGYSSDRTHLSQASYNAIADAVYNKLKSLKYL